MSNIMRDSVNDLDENDMEGVIESVADNSELLEFLIDLGLNTDRLEKITGGDQPRFDENQRELLTVLRETYTQYGG